jgi:STE24 endopeptidase
VAVIAHEIGHYKKKHILKGTVFSILHTGVLFFLLSLFLSFEPLFEAFYVSEPSVYAGLLFFSMLYSPVEVILSMILQAQSRKHEFEADAFARDLTGGWEFLVSALKKLSSHNLSNITPHPFYVFLNYSHPPLKTRIEALRG